MLSEANFHLFYSETQRNLMNHNIAINRIISKKNLKKDKKNCDGIRIFAIIRVFCNGFRQESFCVFGIFVCALI